MVDQKSIVKMNKMIHKKTGASFLVVYVIYDSLVYTDSKKTASSLLPRHAIFATFGRQIKMPICTHTGRIISVPLCSGQSELASIRLLSNLITNLMYNIKKLYFNDQHKFRV